MGWSGAILIALFALIALVWGIWATRPKPSHYVPAPPKVAPPKSLKDFLDEEIK